MHELTIPLMMFVNDIRGNFRGLLREFSLGLDMLLLESPRATRALRCAINQDRFRLGRSQTWLHQGWQQYTSNEWPYDGSLGWVSVWVPLDVATEVVNYLLGQKHYRINCHHARLGEKLDAKTALTVDDVMGCFEERPSSPPWMSLG